MVGPMTSPDDKLSVAVSLLAIAEKELQLAIEQLQGGDRGDKQMVSLVVQAAFDKLAAARHSLEELRVIGVTRPT